MRRMPSLNGLRAFEAAARHGSFMAAGNELNVTQAAVSRMVRLLEARLGFQLFERLPNGLVLTAQGKALQPSLTAAFDSIASATEQVAAMRTTPVLTLGVGPHLCGALDDSAPGKLLPGAPRDRSSACHRRRHQPFPGGLDLRHPARQWRLAGT
jgi:DNA-binding transcriptional LysR family regulator